MVHGLLSRSTQADPAGSKAPVAQGIEHPPSKRDAARSNRAGGTGYHRRRLFSGAEFDALAPRFWSKVDRSAGLAACWPWMRARSLRGYGQWHPYAKVHTPAHRFALALKLGRNLEPAEVAMHLCHNPPCCNPTHLKAGTYSQNSKHSANDGRAFVGELNVMARLTEAQVVDLRQRAATEFRRGWLTQEAQRLGTKSNIVSRIVRGIYWPHVPGAVAIKTNRNFGKPLNPGFCTEGHKLTDGGYCFCQALKMRGYRLARIAREKAADDTAEVRR